MQLLRSRAVFRGLILATLAASTACGDDPAPVPATIVAAGETQFTGTVGEVLSAPISVQVTDSRGRSTGGTQVTFTVAEGGGSVANATATTDGSGKASTTWRLGERAGSQRVTATVAGVTSEVNFLATARAGAPASIAANGGNSQTVVVGTASLTAPSVIVRDRFTNPVPGVSVLFTVGTGGGSLTGNAAITNNAGVATVGEWKMGSTVGAQTMTALALVGGLTGNPVTFTAQATAGAASQVVAVGSTSLSGVVFTAMSPVPQVRVTDAGGNVVANAAVTFTGSTGSTVVGGSKTTDASGLASPDGWVLGTAAGNYTLTASVSGATSATFTAAARAGAPATMTALAGSSQTAPAGRAVPVEPTVRITDVHGNPVSGIEVLFEVGAGGGTAVGRRSTTNAQGQATVGGWTLGDAAGTNTLVASVQTAGVSVLPVTFSATGTAGIASSMAVSAGQNQTAAAGTAVPIAPAVVVRDSRGNPVAGVSVTFSVGAGGGSVTGATAVTNSVGVATVASWVLGGSVGAQTLVVRSGSLPEVTFSATATAGAASRIAAFSSQVQTGIVAGTALSVSQRPAVRVTDEDGNPVAGTTVTFTVATDGSSGYLATGTLTTTAISVTNANGIATVGAWVMPTAAGVTATATAAVSGITESVAFTVQTTPGAVARLQITSNASSSLSTAAGATASTLTITARDVNSNVVTSYTGTKALVFSGPSAAPSGSNPTVDGVNVGGAVAVTFVNGVATAALQVYRAQTVSLSVTDGVYSSGSGSLSLLVAAGAANTFNAVTPSASPSSAAAGVQRTYTVKLVDVFGNGVSGAAISFTASAGVLAASSGTTASDGTVSVSWTAGAATTPTQTITATDGTLSITHTFNVN